MRIKTSELSDIALDWAVAHAMQYVTHDALGWTVTLPVSSEPPATTPPLTFPKNFSPSTRWAQGGPIIELNEIGSFHYIHGFHGPTWSASIGSGGFQQDGPTLLIAAMRCFVASKLGDEVDVPDEFVEAKP